MRIIHTTSINGCIGFFLFVLILNNEYRLQNPVILVIKATSPTTYAMICTVHTHRIYHHTSTKIAINHLIRRSSIHSFFFIGLTKNYKNKLVLFALYFTGIDLEQSI